MNKEKLKGLQAVINEFSTRRGLTMHDMQFTDGHDIVDTDELDGEIYIEHVTPCLTVCFCGKEADEDELRKAVAEYLNDENVRVYTYIDHCDAISAVYEPKVLLLNGVDDIYWHGEEKNYAIRSAINKAITRKYLQGISVTPLKKALQEEFVTVPQLWLSLKVECDEESKAVTNIRFDVDYAGDLDFLQREEMNERYDIGKIEAFVARYMGKLGMRTPCQNAIDVYRFARTLLREVPEAKNYLKLSASFPNEQHD